jgi:hypothetical protein
VWVVRVLAALAVLIAIAVIIAEPWVAPLVSDEAPSGYEMLDDVEIGVGETLSFGGEHFGEETAQVVYISVPEVLEDDENGSVTALGEYYGVRVRVHIKRTGEYAKYAHVINIFGLDITPQYNRVRTFLRTLLGIAQDELPNSERVVRMYEQNIVIKGLDGVTTTRPEVALEKDTSESLELVLSEGQNFEAASSNSAVVDIENIGETAGEFTVVPKQQGKAEIYVVIGFWLSVSEDEYSAYLASEADLPALDGLDSAQTAANHPNQIYIRSSRQIYPISVSDD